MDQNLKQRLIGVTIAVALVVIFLPMLFDKSDDKGKFSATGIPPIPEDVMEKPLELPKTAEDLAPPKEQEQAAEKAPAESGYRIVPFNEDPPPKPKTAAPAAAKSAQEAKGETANGDAGKPPKPAQNEEKTALPDDEAAQPAPVKAPSPAAAAVTNRQAEPKQAAFPKKALLPAAKTQAASAPPVRSTSNPAKKTDAAKTAESAKPVDSAHPPVKTVKVNKPKPAALLPEADDEGESMPVPAKAAETTPKPRAAAANPSPAGTASTAKKPETAKSAEPRQTTKTDASAQTAKPPVAKSAKVGAAANAPAKKPTAWVIQAGSFTDESAAKGLAEKLKQSKFPATVKSIQGEHGPVYKVQVGSERDRSHAEETLKQMEGSTGINGVITPRH